MLSTREIQGIKTPEYRLILLIIKTLLSIWLSYFGRIDCYRFCTRIFNAHKKNVTLSERWHWWTTSTARAEATNSCVDKSAVSFKTHHEGRSIQFTDKTAYFISRYNGLTWNSCLSISALLFGKFGIFLSTYLTHPTRRGFVFHSHETFTFTFPQWSNIRKVQKPGVTTITTHAKHINSCWTVRCSFESYRANIWRWIFQLNHDYKCSIAYII